MSCVYHGLEIRPDPELMVVTKGRRRTKRFKNDMDSLDEYTTRMGQWGSRHFMEPHDTN
jgi:hypothetical protein